jgi:hypothetical protein
MLLLHFGNEAIANVVASRSANFFKPRVGMAHRVNQSGYRRTALFVLFRRYYRRFALWAVASMNTLFCATHSVFAVKYGTVCIYSLIH